MADVQVTEAQLFEQIGRLFVEARARAANEERLRAVISRLTTPQDSVSGVQEQDVG